MYTCGKRFYEPYAFLEHYQRHTKRVLHTLLNFGLGYLTVIRWFDCYYTHENYSLPQILAIDEFKRTTEKENIHASLETLGLQGI
jgi:transposase